MISAILESVFAPLLVAVVWVVAFFTLANDPTGGIAPLLAGLIGGAAFVLQACVVRAKGVGRVFRARPSAVAAAGLIAFVIAIAISLSFDPDLAARPMLLFAHLTVSLAGAASFLMRLAFALTIAAVIAQAGVVLFENGESGQ